MQPRIDPSQLLKCLSVLLSSSGGIKSKDEVNRIANLMTKFSKKLVSKCIYVLILKSTEIDILDMFMSAGGWDLVFTWLSDGINVKNWSLVEEIVELLLLCPVNIQRLKGNNCPKIIKSLSKDVTATEKVRELACEVVEQWLAIVKGACEATSSYQLQQAAVATTSSTSAEQPTASEKVTSDQGQVRTELPVYKITIRDGKQVLAEVISDKTGSRVDNTPAPDDESSRNSQDAEETSDVSEEPTTSVSGRPVRNRKMRVLDKPSDSESESSQDETHRPKSRKRIQTGKGAKSVQNKKKKVEEKKPAKEEKSKKATIVRTRAPDPKVDLKKNQVVKVTKHPVAKPVKLEKEMLDKDRATLAKLITPSISSMGRIPKKSKEEKKDDKQECQKEEKKPVEPPKPAPKNPKKIQLLDGDSQTRRRETQNRRQDIQLQVQIYRAGRIAASAQKENGKRQV